MTIAKAHEAERAAICRDFRRYVCEHVGEWLATVPHQPDPDDVPPPTASDTRLDWRHAHPAVRAEWARLGGRYVKGGTRRLAMPEELAEMQGGAPLWDLVQSAGFATRQEASLWLGLTKNTLSCLAGNKGLHLVHVRRLRWRAGRLAELAETEA